MNKRDGEKVSGGNFSDWIITKGRQKVLSFSLKVSRKIGARRNIQQSFSASQKNCKCKKVF